MFLSGPLVSCVVHCPFLKSSQDNLEKWTKSEMASELCLSLDDYKRLQGFIVMSRLRDMKDFLSRKGIDLSDPILWTYSEDRCVVASRGLSKSRLHESTKRRLPLILLAIKHGQVEITRCLLEHYPKTISIDHHFPLHPHEHLLPDSRSIAGNLLHASLTYDTRRFSLELVKCLLEAGVSANLRDSKGRTSLHVILDCAVHSHAGSIVHCLVKYGADVNAVDYTGNTPLHLLVKFSDFISTKLIRCLVEHGADVNAKNNGGYTPLMFSVLYNSRDIMLHTIQCLLEMGADPNVLDYSGFSILHHAVFNMYYQLSECDSIQLSELLSKGANPMFKSAPCSSEERQQYVPCPLYIAASNGNIDWTFKFLKHPQCPPVCKAEAYLLLASTEIDKNGLSLRSQELWSEALSIYEENNIHPAYLPPIEAYGNQFEIQSVKELQELVSSSTSDHEAHYQSLIIRERCIGMGSACRSLIEALTARAMRFLEEGKHSEGERLFLHWIDVIIHVSDHVQDAVHDYFRDASKTYTGFYNVHRFYSSVCDWLKQLCGKYVPKFEHIAENCERLYRSLFRHYSKSETVHPIFLAILLLSLACKVTLNSEPSCVHCALDELGHRLVLKLLQEPDTLNLLHMSLSIVLQMEGKYPYDPAFSVLNREHSSGLVSMMSNAVLRWGAYKLLDQPISKGQRFLHLAVQSKYAAEIVPILLEYSPHLDAVDADGKTAFDLCTSDELRSLFPSTPHPLSCQAAKVVVSENIPYQELDLPAHMKSLISLHDCHHL